MHLYMPLPSFSMHTDINECSINNGSCSQTCTNLIGSYFCSCQTGYILAGDGTACVGKYKE